MLRDNNCRHLICKPSRDLQSGSLTEKIKTSLWCVASRVLVGKAHPGKGEGVGEQCPVINTDRPLTRPHGNQPMCGLAGGSSSPQSYLNGRELTHPRY